MDPCDGSHSSRKGRENWGGEGPPGTGPAGLGELGGFHQKFWEAAESFDIREGQALPSFAAPFQGRPRPRAGLAGAAEDEGQSRRELLALGLRVPSALTVSSPLSVSLLPLLSLLPHTGPNHCVPAWEGEQPAAVLFPPCQGFPSSSWGPRALLTPGQSCGESRRHDPFLVSCC